MFIFLHLLRELQTVFKELSIGNNINGCMRANLGVVNDH